MNQLSADDVERATAIARNLEIELKFDRRIAETTASHEFSAALVTRLLLIAAQAHRGDRESFVSMARAAIAIVAHQTERADFRHSAFRLAST